MQLTQKLKELLYFLGDEVCINIQIYNQHL